MVICYVHYSMYISSSPSVGGLKDQSNRVTYNRIRPLRVTLYSLGGFVEAA